jgi:O-antigen/teichoic acid export membrane protein
MSRLYGLLSLSPWIGSVGSRSALADSVMGDEVRSLGSRLTRTSIRTFAILIGGAAIGYLAQVCTARLIGAESFGTYSYVLAWITLLGYLSTLGFNVSLLRLLPAYRTLGQWPLVGGVLRFAIRGTAMAGVLVAMLAAPVVLWKYGAQSELGIALLLGLPAVPLIALRLVNAAAVRAFGGIVSSMIPERLMRDGVALALLAAAVTSGILAADAVTATTAMLLSGVVLLATARMLLKRITPAQLMVEPPSWSAHDWIRPTLPLTIIMIADVLTSRSGTLVLGLRGNTVEAGIYAVAFNVAVLTVLPRMAIANLFAPTVSELYARRDMAALQALLAKAASLSLLASSAVALPIVAAAPYLLSLFGPEFTSGTSVLIVLVAGQLFASALGPQQHLLTMTGREWAGAAMMGACVGASLIFGFLLAGSFGMLGAASAVSGGVVVWNLAMAWFVFRKLGLRPGPIAANQAWRENAPAVAARQERRGELSGSVE